MDEELKPGDKWRLIRKEGGAGFFNGLILGALPFWALVLYLCGKILRCPYGLWHIVLHRPFPGPCHVYFESCRTVVPMGFKKIHIDPAVASGPLITTVTDLVGIVTYYTCVGDAGAWIGAVSA